VPKGNVVTPSKSAILGTVKQIRASEKTAKMEIDPKDAALYQLAQMPGWEQLKKYIERRIESLGEIDGMEKMDLADIGMRYIMINLVKEELKNVINMVEVSSKFVEEQEEE